MRIPAEPETLTLVAVELDLRVDLPLRLAGVLRAIEDEDLSIDTHSGENVRVLRLVPRLVDLAGVVNLLSDVELDLGGIARLAIAANLAPLIVVVFRIRLGRLGNFHLGDLEVVRLFLRRVGANEETVNSDIPVLGLFHIGEPLCGESGPL